MDTFKSFFMGMPVAERIAFAVRCGTSRQHLTNIAYGLKPCGESLAINIERESGGKVLAEQVCPGPDWAVIRGRGNRKSRKAA